MKVICAICSRPVDRLTCIEDMNTAETVMRAECHGAVDIVRVSSSQLANLTLSQIEALNGAVGRAFDTERLPC